MSEKLFSLGRIYPSDFLKPDEQPRCEPVELSLTMHEDGYAHLTELAPKDCMWGDRYWYKSGSNKQMVEALKDVVDSILPLTKNDKERNWLDIACNDLTLLNFVPKNLFYRMGIDPSLDKTATIHKGVLFKKYFGEIHFENGHFDIITAISMFYDIEDVDSFLSEVCRVMANDGLFVVQMSYTPLMIKQLAMDNICHEHYAYHSLSSMTNILERNGLKIADVTLNDVNGGSFRLFVKKKGQLLGTQTYRDVCKVRIYSLLDFEKKFTWEGFYEKIIYRKEQVTFFIKQAKYYGNTIMAYGASTKGNTLLQFFGLDNMLITAIADVQERKWGLRTVGTNIPIISEEEMREAQPDYLLVLPWHFESSFIEREKDYINKGGKLIFPCPQFKIYSKDGYE